MYNLCPYYCCIANHILFSCGIKLETVNATANASVKLNKTQIAIVKAIINNNHVTYDNLKTFVGVNRSTITRNIAVLKEKGVICRVGEDKMDIGKCD